MLNRLLMKQPKRVRGSPDVRLLNLALLYRYNPQFTLPFDLSRPSAAGRVEQGNLTYNCTVYGPSD